MVARAWVLIFFTAPLYCIFRELLNDCFQYCGRVQRVYCSIIVEIGEQYIHALENACDMSEYRRSVKRVEHAVIVDVADEVTVLAHHDSILAGSVHAGYQCRSICGYLNALQENKPVIRQLIYISELPCKFLAERQFQHCGDTGITALECCAVHAAERSFFSDPGESGEVRSADCSYLRAVYHPAFSGADHKLYLSLYISYRPDDLDWNDSLAIQRYNSRTALGKPADVGNYGLPALFNAVYRRQRPR